MPSVLAYSAITTKIKAMNKKLFNQEDYDQLMTRSSVGDALSFLKRKESYEILFRDFNEINAHRGDIEALLTYSLYDDFSKLYRFANLKQRKFMDLYFMKYEIDILKRCMRRAYSGSDTAIDLKMFRDFFEKHSDLDIIKISSSQTMHEFLQAISNTKFYATLNRISNTPSPSLFDYEMSLDLFYFSYIWRAKNKVLSGKELNIIAQNFGNKIDLLNVQWIYRAKKYYNLTPADIYAFIIPINYKIKKSILSAMVESATLEDMQVIMNNTFYARQYSEEVLDSHSIEIIYISLMDAIYHASSRKNPYSVASINTYLYQKEHEIHKITTIIEGIRYGLSPQEIDRYAINK